jgi:hypothetical protein
MFDALRQTLAFLSFDELPADERPPRKIWLKGKELREWMKAVERRRKEKYGSESGDDIDGPVSTNDTKALLGMR